MTSPRQRLKSWQDQRSASARQTWRATDALRRGLVLGVAMVVGGALLHRLAPVLLGAPLLVSSVLALLRPLGGRPTIRARPLPRTVESGQRARLLVDVEPGDGAELVAIRLPSPDRSGIGPVHVVPATARVLVTRMHWDAWGEHADLRPDHLVAGPDGLWAYGPVVGDEARRAVLPVVRPLPPGLLPPRAAGLVGAHRSRRPGDGIELRNIRAYQPGDRLRGVDWRATLRSGSRAESGADVLNTLFVRERHAEADADVIIAMDTRVDVDVDLAGWAQGLPGFVRPGGSLATSVDAATALAASYLRQGDRVGFVDLGRPQFGLRPGAGRRQLLRLRHRLLVCARNAGWAPRPVLRAEQVPPGAVVVVLSPFLDDAVVQQTMLAARRGSLVLAVDVLPGPLLPDPDSRWGSVVAKVISGEHDIRLAALRGRGVPVVSWVDGAEVVALLRRAAAPGRRPVGRR
ncbi:MAG TPA: DUF58 domain-containing protein [Pseudonocardiaceae bacterium]